MALIALIVSVLAQTQTGTSSTATTTASVAGTSTSGPVLIPPKPIGAAVIPYPEGAPPHQEVVEVTVRLEVGADGQVRQVSLVRGAGPPFDEAVLIGATAFTFEPATWGGQPVPVEIQFTQRFAPPPPPPPPAERPRRVLAGRLEEKGTRRPIAFASIILTSSAAAAVEITSDEAGRFEVALPPGPVRVEVLASAYHRFLQSERLVAGERIAVLYLVERAGPDPYEVVVIGKRDRTEVARTRLRGRDIDQVPGTFGDPFRVVSTLPGVSQLMSLLPFPVVRGSSPGNTGFLIDGVRVPLLFHLLAGPSVIHPELIDEIVFSPGGFPVEYGGYTGGIVDGLTRPAGADEVSADLDLNFFQLGALGRRPIEPLGVTGTLAGRFGFPGVMVSLASPRVALSYWDYQARVDGGDKSGGWTVFAFGASDALDMVPTGQPDDADKEPFLHFTFHRLDLRYHHRGGGWWGSHQITLGYDDSLSSDEATLSSFSATPRIKIGFEPSPQLELRAGFDGLIKQASFETTQADAGAIGDLLGGVSGEPSDLLLTGGVFGEVLWRPVDELLIRPGVRVDGYYDLSSRQIAADPRLLARWLAAEPDLGEGAQVWLKAGVGLYHQPPRFTIPLPGLDQIAFERGLLESTQATLGAELILPASWSIDVQTYFNWMDPILYDVQINPEVGDVLNRPPEAPPGQAPPEPPRDTDGLDDRLDRILAPATGRSYGVELLVRRESATGVSGWVSYTFSRAERLREGRWVGFDFDRSHILNLVLGIPLPRRWQIGLRGQLQTGRPLTTTSGLSAARTGTFVRFDLRIDKTAVWNDWLLDFYVDISNAVLASEELAPEQEVRYVLPTVGFRAMF